MKAQLATLRTPALALLVLALTGCGGSGNDTQNGSDDQCQVEDCKDETGQEPVEEPEEETGHYGDFRDYVRGYRYLEEQGFTGKGSVIAIADSGVDTGHEAFANASIHPESFGADKTEVGATLQDFTISYEEADYQPVWGDPHGS